MGAAANAWAGLEEPWRLALDEAWRSWCDGSAGVGAVLVAPGGRIVSTGRNRMLATRDEPGVLAGTILAHAEMNALALAGIGATVGATIYTTFEPCLMCAGAIIQSRIGRVCYAAADPVFDGMHDWFGSLPFAAERLPVRDHLGGPIGAFCHVLHLSWLAFWSADGPVIDAHRRLAPAHLEIASLVARNGALGELAAEGGTVVDALQSLWPRLVA